MKRERILGILVVAVLTLVFGIKMWQQSRHSEAFINSASAGGKECPTEAKRGPDGRIYIKPGTRSFGTLPDYVGYLRDLYAGGEICIAPKVQPNRASVAGILGGLGNGQEPPAATNMQGAEREVLNFDQTSEMTSAKTPINKLDDFEYTRVFQSEKQERMAAGPKPPITSHIFDWAKLPFNSEERAAKEDEFVAGRMEGGFRDPKSGVFFNLMEGNTIEPPDVEAAKQREQKVMASYHPTAISKHIIDSETESVGKLVHDTYASDPVWEPVVTKVGENKYEVTELRPKPRVEQYEDDKTVSLATAEERGIAMPPPTLDIHDRLQDDPYFDKSGVGDRNNSRYWNYNDFKKWTPGLERMFAPTEGNKEWY
jgi:hypothetical protein